MRVAVSVEQRFDRTPDGCVWTDAAFGYAFWQQYLGVFDEVLVLARVHDVTSGNSRCSRADGDGVSFLPVPYYIGPVGYLANTLKIREVFRHAPISRDAVVLRVPSPIATLFESMLEGERHPYGVEVVGDPYEVFAPGAVRHALRPFFRWWFPRQMKRVCARACACAYVTQHNLPNRYPAAVPAFSNCWSDVLLPDEAYIDGGRQFRDFSPCRVVTIGSLQQRYKGIDLLIDATAVCIRAGVNVELTVIGDGQYRHELEKRATLRGLNQRVRFVGSLAAPGAIRSELDRADLFVLASRTEGLPRAMLEAMARGLPCIGSNVGGIPELLHPSSVVPMGDVAALASKMQKALHDWRWFAAMSSYNLSKAREYHSEVLKHKRKAFLQRVLLETKHWINRQSEVPRKSPQPAFENYEVK